MRKLLYFLAAVCLWTGCSDEYDDSAIKGDIDDLKDKVAALEQQIASLKQEATKINNDIAALKDIADGIAITKVTENADGGYTVTFSNGKSYTIANGQKGDQGPQGPQGPEGAACTPMMRIDSEGYWQVSYDGGTTWEYPGGEKISALGQTGATGDQGAQGQTGATPQISVDSEGYWTVSYDGGKTFERMKDAAGNEIKAVVSEGTGNVSYKSVFESVSYSAENSTLQVVLAGTTEVLEIPVGGAALAQLYAGENPVEGVQTFAAGETKSYTVKAPTADMVKVVGYPDGWTVTLTDMTLDVTAPAAQSRATADSATDVSLLVVMKNGLATVLRMQVTVDGTAVEPVALATPVVTLSPASVTAGAEQAVVATWKAVANATSYKVSFNGAAATSVTEATYTIAAADVKALAMGEYKLSVVAVPADAVAYTESAAGEATLTVTEATTPPATGDVLEWGSSVFEQFYNSIGTDSYTADVDLGNGMKFIAGEGKCKFGKSGDDYRIQLGGSGNTTSCTLQFTVAGPGTLEVDIQSSGSGDRYLAVAIDGTEVNADGFVAPDSSASRQVHTIDCSAAKAGSVINLYSKKSAINVYKVKWTSK